MQRLLLRQKLLRCRELPRLQQLQPLTLSLPCWLQRQRQRWLQLQQLCLARTKGLSDRELLQSHWLS